MSRRRRHGLSSGRLSESVGAWMMSHQRRMAAPYRSTVSVLVPDPQRWGGGVMKPRAREKTNILICVTGPS